MTDYLKPLAADEIEEVRLAATKLPPRSYNTVQRLIATIERQREQIEKLRGAVKQALWHIGEDFDRSKLVDEGAGWLTSQLSACELFREALAATEPFT